ncbi:MAG: 16S rRNA (uracil(1498)-N(3))-methyltransferase [Syntrophales bacterium]|nr:16S rRNA (uracil(1498)-N(3))-methyltransferase [Syntrophales bacterium]
MSRTRVLLPSALDVNRFYVLTEEEEHYLTRVLRLRTESELAVFDGEGKEGIGILTRDRRDGRLGVRVISVHEREEGKFNLIFCPSLTKGNKMDLVVQKVTELGVKEIIPIITRRSVSRPKDNEMEKKVARWRKIAQEATRQSGRTVVPIIYPPLEFTAFLDRGYPSGYLPVILWEEGGEPLEKIVQLSHSRYFPGAMIVVGPEGGFDCDEVQQAKGKGFVPLWLGAHVLRAETAAIVICTLIQYTIGDFFAVAKGMGR